MAAPDSASFRCLNALRYLVRSYVTKPTTMRAITEMPAKTPKPMGSTEIDFPGTENAALGDSVCCATFADTEEALSAAAEAATDEAPLVPESAVVDDELVEVELEDVVDVELDEGVVDGEPEEDVVVELEEGVVDVELDEDVGIELVTVDPAAVATDVSDTVVKPSTDMALPLPLLETPFVEALELAEVVSVVGVTPFVEVDEEMSEVVELEELPFADEEPEEPDEVSDEPLSNVSLQSLTSCTSGLPF